MAFIHTYINIQRNWYLYYKSETNYYTVIKLISLFLIKMKVHDSLRFDIGAIYFPFFLIPKVFYWCTIQFLSAICRWDTNEKKKITRPKIHFEIPSMFLQVTRYFA